VIDGTVASEQPVETNREGDYIVKTKQRTEFVSTIAFAITIISILAVNRSEVAGATADGEVTFWLRLTTFIGRAMFIGA
jgi:hypothetical protein